MPTPTRPTPHIVHRLYTVYTCACGNVTRHRDMCNDCWARVDRKQERRGRNKNDAAGKSETRCNHAA